MAISKITLNGTTQMDVTQDTVDEDNLLAGETATKANGVRTTGTLDLPVGVGEPYAGVDLTTKFATEIATYSNNPWAWIKARITAGDYSGIHIGDYIPFTCTNTAATALNARIIGINTYKQYGTTAIGNHIDFWAGLWDTNKPINVVNYNNGTSVSSHPWLASDAYLYANSLQGSVPSAATANPTLTSKDYRTNGIYYFLPTALKNVIVEKSVELEQRYNASSLLSDATAMADVNIGKIWFPHEIEVCGTTHWTKTGYASCGFVAYPFFQANMNRLAFGKSNWWLLSPSSGATTYWCFCANIGQINQTGASNAYIKPPVCFRIA